MTNVAEIEDRAAPAPGAVLQARWKGVGRSGDGVGGYYERLMLEPLEVGMAGVVMPRFLLMDLSLRGVLRHFGAREGDVLELLLTHVDVSGFAMFVIVGSAERPAAREGRGVLASVRSVGDAGRHERDGDYRREAGRRIAREIHGLGWESEDDPLVEATADEFSALGRLGPLE